MAHPRAAPARLRGTRAIRGQLQHRRRAGEFLLPEGERGVVVFLALGLPGGVVGVLKVQRRQAGRGAAGALCVEAREFVHEELERPAVEDDVVDVDGEARALVGGAQEARAEQRAALEVEGLAREGLDGRVGGALGLARAAEVVRGQRLERRQRDAGAQLHRGARACAVLLATRDHARAPGRKVGEDEGAQVVALLERVRRSEAGEDLHAGHCAALCVEHLSAEAAGVPQAQDDAVHDSVAADGNLERLARSEPRAGRGQMQQGGARMELEASLGVGCHEHAAVAGLLVPAEGEDEHVAALELVALRLELDAEQATLDSPRG